MQAKYHQKVRGGGRTIGVDIEFIDLKNLVGLFWENRDGKWKGVLKESLGNVDFRVVRNDKVILLLRAESLAVKELRGECL